MKELPKYVQKALIDRMKYQEKANNANQIITDYAEKLGLITTTSDTKILQDGAFLTDVKIFCEPETAFGCSESMLVKALNNLPLFDEEDYNE